MSMNGGNDDGVPIGARMLSCFPYILPILDGINSGRNIYEIYPEVKDSIYGVLGSTLALWNGIPFLGFGVFLAFTFAARNQELPRLVRFSLQQAIIIDITLIVFGLLGDLTKAVSPGASAVLTNTEFYFLVSSIFYCFIRNLQGKEPNEIPIVSDAAMRSMGPY
eukprot:CAMPEP_0171458198 /NCGR_PEP_ID=MMETSP0945-20130129/3976_1 /TAXON_ID=109269 /ORGANISM="Vaucheria litorea, Strain CCMP2940" /LENGTH=163 /DNA_ID=CAMNT_0011983965 /DNA_START=166 /DNA_END=657 /DNA_ORIENTATION=+